MTQPPTDTERLVEELRRIKELSCPNIRIERPRHNLDDVWSIAYAAEALALSQAGEIERLRGALEPFAKVGRALRSSSVRYDVSGAENVPMVDASDFRNAASALSPPIAGGQS